MRIAAIRLLTVRLVLQIDKNSLWDELNMPKKELCVKKKKSQDMGGFLKTSCEDRDQEISERDWDDSRQNIHAHPSIKK